MYGLLKPLVQTNLQNSISAIQLKMMPEDYSKKCSLPNSHFDKNLAWLQSEVCHFINWLTKDLTRGLAKQGAEDWSWSFLGRAHLQTELLCFILFDFTSNVGFSNKLKYQYQSSIKGCSSLCVQSISEITFLYGNMCYLTWCRDKNFGEACIWDWFGF